ncbi:response regulator transcription factor [Candidatus Formimonas warabiya]|uniref:Stage 0 sporulation protein A homolog n=1 Tax=Formimonas warabiya TaxID=1761012 RepID=A0A3G1KRP9_FORW1|nr:response regulator transcription factor [Candidatus Formimonas warabiya]ATW25163.1 DNA-binding response regulator [Candidatus Formimonas warabiya]
MPQILLIEDDKTIIMGLSYSLREEGYEVLACYDAASALREIQSRRFDLAILDVSLPDGNGYDLCRAIKKVSDTPVIFLTVYNEESHVVMGLDMGADDYVAKPFRLRELLSRVRTVLRRAGGEEKDEISIGELTVHVKQGKATKNGAEIPLTALEYRLLLTFAINHGQLLTRSQLLEDIWDIGGDFVNDNTLTVYIKRLREKIEDDAQNPVYIRTMRGLGYRMGD